MGSNTSKEKELLKIINELLDNDYKDRIVDDDIELISQYPEYEDYIARKSKYNIIFAGSF